MLAMFTVGSIAEQRPLRVVLTVVQPPAIYKYPPQIPLITPPIDVLAVGIALDPDEVPSTTAFFHVFIVPSLFRRM
jgi:hypothetical protein